MTAIGVIDTTFDGGNTWNQFFEPNWLSGDWKLSVAHCAGSSHGLSYQMALSVSVPASNVSGAGSATYVTQTDGRYWIRLN